MGLFRRIAQLREEQILSHAEPYIEDGEDVVHWVRACNVEGKRTKGFLFITDTRVVLHWTRGPGSSGHAEWHQIDAWGVNRDIEGGPVLAVEADEAELRAQMPVMTSGMAKEVRGFLRIFADHAPQPRKTLSPQPHPGSFEPVAEGEIERKHRTITEHTKRLIVTIIGAVLFIGGIVMIPLPGPWSFPVIVGGLALLATEYDWADDLLDWTKRRSKALAEKIRRRKPDEQSPPPTV